MRPAFRVVAAALAVGILYAALAWGAGFLYDDRHLVLDEPRPHGIAALAVAWTSPYYGVLPYYRPLTRLTYLVQKGLFGDAPLPFHLANAALAAALLAAAYGLLRRPRFGIAPVPALLAAALFVLHPAGASCVLPIAGRDTLLPVLFMIGAVACWVTPGRLARFAAFALFSAALLAKEVAIATPLLFVLADATAEDRPRDAATWLGRHAPWVVIAAAYVALRHVVLADVAAPLRWSGHPSGSIETFAYGLQTAFVPFLHLVYEPALRTWLSVPRLALAAAVTTFLVLEAWRAGPPHGARNVLFWLGWFVAVQLPAANLVRQETPFDERYAFPALLGVLALAAMALSPGPSPNRRRASTAAWIGAIAAAAALTVHRAPVFGDELAFQRAWAETSPGSADAQNGLGVALLDRGKPDEAEIAFRAALAANPDHPEAENNLGVLLLERGETEDALSLLDAAVASSPGYAAARYNLANARAREGRLEDAAALYHEAIELRPGYVSAWNNLGAVLAREGRLDAAIAAFRTVVRLDPSHAKALVDIGILLARQGRYTEAIASYRDAIALAPDDPDARFDLGAAAFASGDRSTAEKELAEALRLKPAWEPARALLEQVRSGAPQSNNVGGGSRVNDRR